MLRYILNHLLIFNYYFVGEDKFKIRCPICLFHLYLYINGCDYTTEKKQGVITVE
jgi:hypothetical protein